MTVCLRIFDKTAWFEDITDILGFVFAKDAYTPYSQLTVTFKAGGIIPSQGAEIFFWVGTNEVHHGFIDTYSVNEESGFKKAVITSRSYTSLLLDSQLPPGLYTNISINSLMTDYAAMPFVTYEGDSTESYIYVKNGSSIWDGISNLSYKLFGKYPYIRGSNHVTFNAYPDAQTFTYTDGQLTSKGSGIDTRKLVSFFSMADINDQYGSYTCTEQEAAARNISRSRYFEHDRRFLYAPQQAVEFRDKMSMRGWSEKFFTYSGYGGEDLFDAAVYNNVQSDITSVKITGNRNGISTRIGLYTDKFVSPVNTW